MRQIFSLFTTVSLLVASTSILGDVVTITTTAQGAVSSRTHTETLLSETIQHPRDESRELKILMLGNSYTWNLPHNLMNMINSHPDAQKEGCGPRVVKMDSFLIGGTNLGRLSKDAGVIAKIRSEKWTHVTLQDNSVMPLFNADYHYETTAVLASYIKEHSPDTTTVIMFQTWPRADTGSNYPMVGLADEVAWNNLYKTVYGTSTRNTVLHGGLKARMSPTGSAFTDSMVNDPWRTIHQADTSHENADGLQISTLSMAATITCRPATEYAHYTVPWGTISDVLAMAQLVQRVIEAEPLATQFCVAPRCSPTKTPTDLAAITESKQHVSVTVPLPTPVPPVPETSSITPASVASSLSSAPTTDQSDDDSGTTVKGSSAQDPSTAARSSRSSPSSPASSAGDTDQLIILQESSSGSTLSTFPSFTFWGWLTLTTTIVMLTTWA